MKQILATPDGDDESDVYRDKDVIGIDFYEAENGQRNQTKIDIGG